MTTFENFGQAKKFFALIGGFWAFDHARNRDSNFFLKLHGILITNQKSDLVRNDLHTKLTPAPSVVVMLFDQRQFLLLT